ncbi:MAG TPA: DUF3160 domain-containing protein [Prolixibacteraceae bacterium]|nr:DUF3160 domain-containing protein [Prolixibacteraceae bacterium]
MKTKFFLPVMFLLLSLVFDSRAQLNIDEYQSFLKQTKNLEFSGLNSMYPKPANAYYKGFSSTPDFGDVLYFDSVKTKYSLKDDELSLLKTNHFFVSDRLSCYSFDEAFTDIFTKDLPVFISTDAILHVLHLSYDRILKDLERGVMSSNLEEYLKVLYDNVPSLVNRYSGKGIDESLRDVDLYTSIAYSLITGKTQPVRIASETLFNTVMEAISNESVATVSLFSSSDKLRTIDFSQFKVRGHYVYTDEDKMSELKSLEPYFKAMMWLGRIDFYLTTPETMDVEWEKDDIRRMNISAFLLNEIHRSNTSKSLFEQNEKIINYMVGESDNITLDEFNNYLGVQSVSSAEELLNDSVYDAYYTGLLKNESFRQKIMSGIYFVDPEATEPAELPISFFMSGQRFIIDSEILSNVVFDRIYYNGEAQWRLMPDPLDALFALGNNDATCFLENEINTYHYAGNLANMRYLVDQKESSFWNSSLYNAWLNAIRTLNPTEEGKNDLFFMKTSAWHQQKMNTQLASWTELRHDNLLYAKSSYTAVPGCSFPFSYVEPYPEFYGTISSFCKDIGQFISSLTLNFYPGYDVRSYYRNFSSVMDQLKTLADKELNNEPFSDSENEWLKKMLKKTYGDCGTPPYTGWFYDLVLDRYAYKPDNFLTVDIHTQSADSTGALVGKVLHTGTGEINLGTFLIKPAGSDQYVAFTGPFMSYYEKITTGFNRLTDQDWEALIESNPPARPEWTNSYLVNKSGEVSEVKIELPSSFLVSVNDLSVPGGRFTMQYYPNPVTNELNIENKTKTGLNYLLYDGFGSLVKRGAVSTKGKIDFSSCPKGLYLLKVDANGRNSVFKILKE